jgi:tRNA(Ile)-lysidine synthase
MSDAALPIVLDRSLESFRHARRWWIACSGGVDSLALLHAVVALTRAAPGRWPELRSIHVNHQLHPQAPAWAEHVQAQCRAEGVDCEVRAVVVQRATGEGVEAAARRVRYAAFEAVLGTDDVLLQAHHRDDQIETFFLHLLRGSGVSGLRGIPATRALGKGRLLRPWLDIGRAEILAYAEAHALRWVEDDSNADTRFDRNFLRQQVLPLLAQRWPAYRDTVGRSIELIDDCEQQLQALVRDELSSLVQPDGRCATAGLLRHPPARQRLLLRGWLQGQGIRPPGRGRLDALRAMVCAAEDARPCVAWDGVEVRRFRGHLHALPALPASAGDFDLPWSPGEPLPLPEGNGTLCALVRTGTGLRADLAYRVRNRRGGERCHPLGRAHSQTLKKLLQEADIPPWWRDRMPLVWCGDTIAAVGDLWICRGFEAAADAAGWQPQWLRPGEKVAATGECPDLRAVAAAAVTNLPPELARELERLARQFRRDLPQRLAALDGQWQQARREFSAPALKALHRAVHGLVGSAATFGLQPLAAAARALEQTLQPLPDAGAAALAGAAAAVDAGLAQLGRIAAAAADSGSDGAFD